MDGRTDTDSFVAIPMAATKSLMKEGRLELLSFELDTPIYEISGCIEEMEWWRCSGVAS